MVNIKQFSEFIVIPTLLEIDLFSRSAHILVTGTALVESRLEYIKQIKGPALGFYQMEPATHDDIWENYLKYRTELSQKIHNLSYRNKALSEIQLIGNLPYATAMCRVHYLRRPEPLPEWNNVKDMAQYWKQWYNTPQGSGTIEKAVPWFQKAIDEIGG